VLSQNGDFDLEWVVVDGGSMDATVEFLEGLQDPRIVWASEPDRGQTHALQKGMGRATGDVIGWLNSDDLYLPEALATVAAEFADHAEADWLIGRAVIIDVEGREIRRWITRYKDRVLAGYRYKRLLRENFINYNGVF
jgi:glycosyltransferase involved in cell wall biosynthesis